MKLQFNMGILLMEYMFKISFESWRQMAPSYRHIVASIDFINFKGVPKRL